MATHESAKKRARQNVKRNLRNRSFLSRIKSAIKTFRTSAAALKEGKLTQDELQKHFVNAQSLLSSAVTKGILHANNSSRRIARLAKLMKANG